MSAHTLYCRSNGRYYAIEGTGKDRKFTSLKTRDRAEAERKLALLIKGETEVKDVRLSAFFNYSSLHHSENTQKWYRDVLLGNYHRGSTWSERIKSIEQDGSLRARTRQGYAKAIRAFMSWERGESKKPRRVVEARLTKAATPEDIENIRPHLDPIMQCVVDLTFATGLRLQEVVNLSWGHVFREVIYVPEKEGELPKGADAPGEVVGISKRVRDVLDRIRALGIEGDTMFGLTYKQVQDRFREAKRAAGYGRELVFHSLRHGFGTWLGRNGMDAFTIQRAMRHSSVEQTRQYVHTDVLHATERIDSIGG